MKRRRGRALRRRYGHMKISGRTVHLSRAETKKWEKDNDTGRAFRAGVLAKARALASKTGEPVAVETPEYTAEHVYPL